MLSVALLVLSLLWSQTASQALIPRVTIDGQTLANHSYVDVNLVGDPYVERLHSVQCHTDLSTCCSSMDGVHRGDWYSPSETKLTFSSGTDPIYQQRLTERVDLRRRSFVTAPTGIYRCEIPTQAVHGNGERESVYVGIYYSRGGTCNNIVKGQTSMVQSCALFSSGNVRVTGLTVKTSLSGVDAQFIFTCVSTGGPATTVTWTRDSVTVTEGTKTVLDDPVTAQYTHTLTVTDIQVGLYRCTVANNKPSRVGATLLFQGMILILMCLCGKLNISSIKFKISGIIKHKTHENAYNSAVTIECSCKNLV